MVVAGSPGTSMGSVFEVEIVVSREPGSLGGIATPLTLFVVLSWSVFWMDRESLGARIEIFFIGLLKVVAYQLIVEGCLPDIPYLTVAGGFLLVDEVLLAASIVVNLRVGFLDRVGQHAESDRADRKCRWIFPVVYLMLAPPILFRFGLSA